MRIAIVDVLGSPYDGSTPFKRGLGGSESAVVFIAKELAQLGMDVTIFCDCSSLDAKPGVYDGVRYNSISNIESTTRGYRFDVLIASRSIKPLIMPELMPIAKKRILWMHDTFCDGDDRVEALATSGVIDEIWTLSDWHTTYISQCTHGHRRMMEVLKRKIWVTRNGVNIWNDVDVKKKDHSHFVFNAAVSKGMETLLEDIWPKFRERAGDNPHLTVIGGAYPLKNEDIQHDKLKQLVTKHDGKNGVTFTGIISQQKIGSILANAGYMIYPQSFPETFGISTVESLAYGTPVITGRFGAMEETAIESACYLMDYPVDSNTLYTFNKENHVAAFVDLALKAYDDEYLWMQKCNSALRVREVCSWRGVAMQWKQHLWNITGRYLSADDYNKVQRINHRTHTIFNKRWSNPEEWAHYPEKEKLLEVIVPFYNASQYLRKCIESISAQNYENFRLHLVNDVSTDDSSDVANKAMSDFGLRHKTLQYTNIERVGALANQVSKIKHFTKDSIVVLIDGDDALANNPNIFKMINQLYHDGAQMTYGSMWSMVDNIPLIAQEYPREVIEAKSFRDYRLPWNIPYTHLRTFTVETFDSIDDNDLRDSDGSYFKAAGDTALFYALIERCRPDGIKPIRDVIYLYNDRNPINDYKVNSPEQVKNTATIMSTKKETVKALDKWILIAIPTANGIHPETFKSIYDLKIPNGYKANFQFFYGYCVDQVRNLIANYAITNKYSYLFCVDYDMEFAPDTLEKLLSNNVDIVSGLYIQRKPGQHVLEIYRKNENGFDYNVQLSELNNELESITGCGLGCALIKTEVLKEVGYPQFTYHHAIRMEDTVSEDVDFCNKAREKGFQIYANTTVRCRHHGKSAFEVNNG